ncbi:MAG: hypothetical protein ACRC46_15565 [Thermoguttaceae bacterium]
MNHDDTYKNIGDYSKKWTQTFDLQFLIGWVVAVAIMLVVTTIWQPEIFRAYGFFQFCAIKIAVMCVIGTLGGMLCRYYCKADERGYIVAGSHKWFRVNYTRKLQHFAAYLIPLLGSAHHDAANPAGILPHVWESLFVLLAFLLLIKPIRERSTLFMLQFNSMDRPEDRPNTLRWIVCGNLIPALVLSTLFQQLFFSLNEPYLPLIIVLIIGFGDGFAEPVGVYLGKRKYTVPSWTMQKRYVRSYAGSACVFIAGLICVGLFHAEFNTTRSFIAALIVIPPLMTFAEAYSPHSMDTPMMMTLGYSTLALICLW